MVGLFSAVLRRAALTGAIDGSHQFDFTDSVSL